MVWKIDFCINIPQFYQNSEYSIRNSILEFWDEKLCPKKFCVKEFWGFVPKLTCQLQSNLMYVINLN